MIQIAIRGEAKILRDLADLQYEIKNPYRDPSQVQAIVVAGILDNMARGVDPEGIPWPPLSQDYADWKQVVAPGAMMGYLFGAMTEDANLRGVAVSNGGSMTMTYGVDPVAIDHARSFTEGGAATGTAQPPRPFYGITAGAEAELERYFDATFASP